MDLTTALLPVTLAVALLLIALAAVLRRRRLAAVADPAPADDAAEHAPEAIDPDADEDEVLPPEVRVLRAQVRTLVATLEEAESGAQTESLAEVAAYRRRVEATLRAMSRQVHEDDSPERSLARVLAAVERLEQPGSFSRPVLAPARPGEVAALAAAPALAPAAAGPDTAPVLSVAPGPAAEPVTGPSAPEPVTGPSAPEVVLPVPASFVEPASGRRGWRRRDKVA